MDDDNGLDDKTEIAEIQQLTDPQEDQPFDQEFYHTDEILNTERQQRLLALIVVRLERVIDLLEAAQRAREQE